MGQHATMHGKTVESFNGQNGKWVPIAVNASGQIQQALLSGELQAYNRMAGGAIVSYTSLAANTTVKTGAGLLYGIVCIAAGTMAAVYDNTSAAGTVLIPSQALTAGQSFTFAGMGVQVTNGIYASWTSGTWLVLYV